MNSKLGAGFRMVYYIVSIPELNGDNAGNQLLRTFHPETMWPTSGFRVYG